MQISSGRTGVAAGVGVWQAILRGLRVGGDGGQLIASALPKLKRLRVLDLRGTRVGDKGKRNKRDRRERQLITKKKTHNETD